mgnify:CR=1 FL=1
MSPFLRFFPLSPAFFGLTSDYRAYWEEELYICRKHIGWSRQDLMDMSINSRRYQIHLLKAENRAKEESYEEQRKSSGSGGGNRTRSISGDELKGKLKSGEING